MAEGKYINFMDSDDMLGANVVIDCLSFLEGNKKNTDIVTFPVELFGDKDEGHWLNYIFKKGERIIDFFDEHDKPVYAVNHTFFKTDPIKNKIYFDTELTIGEDCRFIYDYIFATRMTVGVLDKCVYYYRKRSGADASALEAGIDTEEYYLPFMKKMVLSILDSALKVYGFIPRFVQFAIMAQLKWRFNMDEKGERAISVIGEERFEEYKELIFKALKNIDDDIILSQDKIWGEHKQYLLSKKYGYPAQKIYTEGKIRYFFGNTFLRSVDSVFCRLTFVDVQSDCLIIEGINYSYEDGFLTFLLVNGKKINVEKLDGRDKNKYCLGDVCLYGEDFSCEIPLDNISDEYNIYVGITIDEKDILKKDLRFGKFFPLSSKYKKSYYTKLGWNLSYAGNCLKLSSVEKSYKRNPEKEFLDELIKVGEVRSAILRQEVLAQKALRNRGFKDRQLWIISDRTNAGGDNGEALFDYVNKQCNQGIDLFFAINKDSHDYGRLKEKGSVVDHSSDYYLRLYLQADCVISSQIDEYVINPFMSKKGYTSEGFKDILCDIKHVFLQHGVTKDDISGWINKSNKNLKGIVTAANPEYMSMLDSKYEYTEKEIWLTGFPRHDLLYHDESNLITIMPTWRKTLSRITEDDVGVREVTDEFKNSDYFEFYNKLINDEKLITEAERAGYKICFMPHPTLWGDIDLFEIDERVLIFGQGDAYKDILAKSDLVITDYSSVAIDFSYLRKPVVYCQFDADEFFKGEHAYTKGYFDYEKDGFGEVTYDMDSLIKMVIKYIKNGCSLKSKYKKRIDAFFAFNDNNNSKRVYEKLVEMNGLR